MRLSQRQLRWSLPLIAGFISCAVGTAAFELRWAALHLALTGATVLLISSVSLWLTVTWSAAAAPSDLAVALQRALIVVGVAMLVIGRQSSGPTWIPVLGALIYALGLGLLGALLVFTVRRGVERRFDLVVAGYVIAVIAGITGAALGADMAANSPTPALRNTHIVLNLLGLIGIVAISTLPPFIATVGRTKMSPAVTKPRVVTVLTWQTITLTVAAIALLNGSETFGGFALVAHGLGAISIGFLLPQPTRRQLTWAGPRLLGLWAGTLWWAISVLGAAASAFDQQGPLDGRWLGTLLVSGYGQIIWGSVAYVLPVIRGGGHKILSAGFARTRSWFGFAALNSAGFAFAFQQGKLALLCAGAALLDSLIRGVSVFFLSTPPDSPKPPDSPTPPDAPDPGPKS